MVERNRIDEDDVAGHRKQAMPADGDDVAGHRKQAMPADDESDENSGPRRHVT